MKRVLLAQGAGIMYNGGANVYPLRCGNGTDIPIVIVYTDIPVNLTNCPVPVHQTSSSEKGGIDMTDAFTKLGDIAWKILVAIPDYPECNIDIEEWDPVVKEAWFWMKVPFISSTQDSTMYSCYDPTHADNTESEGYSGSIPAMNVLETIYNDVSHMTPSGSVVIR